MRIVKFDKLVKLLKYFKGSIYCQGLTNLEYNKLPQQVHNFKRELIGKTDQISSGTDKLIPTKRSVHCVGIENESSNSTSCSSCSSIEIPWMLLFRLKANESNGVKNVKPSTSSSCINWRFLADDERREGIR